MMMFMMMMMMAVMMMMNIELSVISSGSVAKAPLTGDLRATVQSLPLWI
jgi:hypothetical protein